MAVIEMAQASGMTLVDAGKRNPMKTTTYGTGELIGDALANGARKILLTVGGSATNDGGVGMAQALGVSYQDSRGREIGLGCQGIRELHRIDPDKMNPLLGQAEILVACDVQNKLCGPGGASYVYGPQKGADGGMVEEMEALIKKLAKLTSDKTGADYLDIEGLGAAGGIALPLIAFANARIVSGIETILAYTDLDKHLPNADYVFTGEGKIDAQTVYGKVIMGVLNAAEKYDVPVIAYCGIVGDGYEELIHKGLKSCFSIVPGVVSMEDAVRNAAHHLEKCVERVVYLL
jgi:glycerate kinase